MKHLYAPFITIAVIGLLGGSIVYLSRRTAFIMDTKRIGWYIAYGMLLLFCIFALFSEAKMWSSTFLIHGIVVLGSILLGFLLYLLLSMIATDLIKTFIKMPRQLFGCIAFGCALSLTIFSTARAFHPVAKNVTVPMETAMEKEITIVQLSDVHLGHLRGEKHLKKLVSIVNDQEPDMIVFTGDCFESWYNLNDKTLEPFRQLKAPLYFVSGNHDAYVESAAVKKALRKAGVRVLENEAVSEHGVTIIGLDYMQADAESSDGMHASTNAQTIKEVMPKLGTSATQHPIIVLHHTPLGAKYVAKFGADLFLAGHTHGGQLWPMTWINNHAFEYNRGLHKCGNMYVYVSCGSGTFGPPMRLGTRSEVTVLHLK